MTFRTCFTRWPERLPAGRGAPARAMLDVVYQYRLEPARVADAALLAGGAPGVGGGGGKPPRGAGRHALRTPPPHSAGPAAPGRAALGGLRPLRPATGTLTARLQDGGASTLKSNS